MVRFGANWGIAERDSVQPELASLNYNALVERIFQSWADLGSSGHTPTAIHRNSRFNGKKFPKSAGHFLPLYPTTALRIWTPRRAALLGKP
jgi:hypothetical protein